MRKAITPIQSLVKLHPWFLGLQCKTCLWTELERSCVCSERPALEQHPLMMILISGTSSIHTRYKDDTDQKELQRLLTLRNVRSVIITNLGINSLTLIGSGVMKAKDNLTQLIKNSAHDENVQTSHGEGHPDKCIVFSLERNELHRREKLDSRWCYKVG